MEEKKSLESLELERKGIKKTLNIMYAVTAVLLVAAVGCFFFLEILGIIFIVAAVIVISIAVNKRGKFQKTFKSTIVAQLVKDELGPDAIYNPDRGIDINEINSLKVAKKPDKYHLEDYISSSYNNVPYELCDCTMQEKKVTTDGRGHTQTTYVTYFKGRVIKIDYQRELNMVLKVVNNAPVGFSASGLEKFETEVIDFNKKFKCYVDDKEHGFYILTPVMINKMMELERMFNGGICYLFMHNNLYVLINNSSDSLEINISKPLDEKQINRIKSEILIAASIINEFSMDADKYNVNR